MQGDKSMKYATAFSLLFLFILGLPLSVEALTEAQCLAGLKAKGGNNGCYTMRGGCKYGFEYCANDSMCKSNGGVMDGNTCVKAGAVAKTDREAECRSQKGIYDSEHFGCYCSIGSDGTPVKPPPGGECTTASNSSQQTAPQAANPINSTSNANLDACLQRWNKKAQECRTSANVAKLSCDQKDTNDDGMKYVQEFTKNFSGKAIGDNAGKGAVAQCAQASLIGNTAINGMNSFKATCDDNFETCKNECSEVESASRTSVIADECMQYAQTEDEQIRTVNTISAVIEASRNGIQVCSVEAKEGQGLVEQTLKSIGDSVRAAKICECKLSNAGANCELVPDPNNCAPGGALYGQQICNIYADNCALGSSQFSSVACQCARDSSAAICRTPAGKPAPSNFAMDLKPNASSVEVGGIGGPGNDSGNMNLGGNYNVGKPISDYKDPEGKKKGFPPGGGGGGGGPGGGARGGGGVDDPNAIANEGDEGSRNGAGYFSQLKTTISNLMNPGNKKGNAFSVNGRNQGFNYDLNKWRPGRGIASTGCKGSQVRCKNEDIFSIVNRRYDNIEMTFLQSP